MMYHDIVYVLHTIFVGLCLLVPTAGMRLLLVHIQTHCNTYYLESVMMIIMIQ